MCVLALAGTCAARSARAGQPDREKIRLAEALRRGRSGVVLLRTATGICSGTVLDRGFVAASKDRLRAAGQVTAFAFLSKKTEDGRETLDRVEVGRLEVVRLHRSADAALLRVVGGRDPPVPGPFRPDMWVIATPSSVPAVCRCCVPTDATSIRMASGPVAAAGIAYASVNVTVVAGELNVTVNPTASGRRTIVSASHVYAVPSFPATSTGTTRH